MFCSQCGKKINQDSNFCFNCGAKIGMAEEVVEIPSDKPDITPSVEPDAAKITEEMNNVSEIDPGVDLSIAKQARAGNIEAMLKVAKAYSKGIDVSIEPEKAYYWYNKAFEMDSENVNAMIGLADALLARNGDKKSIIAALDLYEKAEERGNTIAMLELADAYFNGVEETKFEKNIDKAIDLCEKAAKSNSLKALQILYDVYCEKYSKDIADIKYIEFLRSEANSGNMLACCCLFECYTDENIVSKDEKTAMYFLNKAVAENCPYAISELAFTYGMDVISSIYSNEAKSNELWEKAAKLNDPWALYVVADSYFDGKNGYPEDMTKALSYAKKCIEYDIYELYNNGCYFILGYIYGKDDETTPFDEKMSFSYFKASADLGDDISQCKVGHNYQYGIGVNINIKKACEYYELSIEQDNPNAMCDLGNILLYGIGVDKNEQRALELFEKSSELGNLEAKEQMGIFYYSGNMLSENKEKAREIFEECAKEGLPQSKHNFAMMNQYGEGGPKILKAAEYWYNSLLDDDISTFNDECKWNIALINCDDSIKDYKKAFPVFNEFANNPNSSYQSDAMYNIALFYANGWCVNQSDVQAKSWLMMSAEKGNKMAADLLNEIGNDSYIPHDINQINQGNEGTPPYVPGMEIGMAKKILIFTSLFLIVGFLSAMILTQDFLLSLLIAYLVAVIPLSIMRLKGLRANNGSNAVTAATAGYAAAKSGQGCAIATGFLIGRWAVNYVISAVVLIYWVIKSIVTLVKYYK